jgi:hypothetical protein
MVGGDLNLNTHRLHEYHLKITASIITDGFSLSFLGCSNTFFEYKNIVYDT